ncbi:NHLP-related RiPP peptide [Duganella callida]|nr:NHLP-related RiPP peptide [Duganella callida]
MQTTTSQDFGAVIGKLASDDIFRERVMADPVGAFGSIGISLDPAYVPAVCQLPSKETMAADLAAFGEKLDNKAAMIIFLMSGNA